MGDTSPPSRATLVAVGDLHRRWRPADRAYLERSQPDLAMFVGDLSDTEEPELTEKIAAVDVPKVVLLGNHDAWRSIEEQEITQELSDSLAVLGSSHLAYGVRDVPAAQVSIVGARPFSYGGPGKRGERGAVLRGAAVYEQLYGVGDFKASADLIMKAAQGARHSDLVILAHNGPTGLGDDPADFCGKDFRDRKVQGDRPGGDWGDKDLELAIEAIEGWGYRVRAVVSGHMHHKLLEPRGAERRRFVRRGHTLYVNCAVVPRLVRDRDGHELAHFVRMQWEGGECRTLEEVWVDANGRECKVVAPEVIDLGDSAQPAVEG